MPESPQAAIAHGRIARVGYGVRHGHLLGISIRTSVFRINGKAFPGHPLGGVLSHENASSSGTGAPRFHATPPALRSSARISGPGRSRPSLLVCSDPCRESERHAWSAHSASIATASWHCRGRPRTQRILADKVARGSRPLYTKGPPESSRVPFAYMPGPPNGCYERMLFANRAVLDDVPSEYSRKRQTPVPPACSSRWGRPQAMSSWRGRPQAKISEQPFLPRLERTVSPSPKRRQYGSMSPPP